MGKSVSWTGLAILLAATSCNPNKPSRILLVTVDTLRADRLGYAGYDVETPNLDALARTGAVFTRAVSAAPLTLPSHTTILSGLYPMRHGTRNNGTFSVPAEVETVAERMKGAGYATAAFVGAFVLDSRFGLDQGFDHYDDELPEENPLSNAYYAERRAEEVVSRALEWVEERRDEKLFVWVHVFDCHAPYLPPAPFDERYPGRPYDGEIAYVDRSLGPLLEAFEDGATVVTADHGEGLGQHGESTHALFVYDATLRVPLLVRAPGVPPGARVEAQVRTADVAPTLLELAGLAPSEGMDGASLLPLLEGAESASRAAYGESLSPYFNFHWAKLRSLQDGRYKVIDAPERELYDLASDPNEEKNLWSEDAPPAARGMMEELERIAAQDAGPEASAPLDEASLRRLESLGYASGSAPLRESSAPLPDPKDRVEVFERLQGILARSDASPDELIAEYRKVLALEPQNAWARIRLANVLADERRYEEAIVEFQELTRSSALEARGYKNLGVALLLLGRVEEALATTEKALNESPWDPDLHVLRGEALEKANRLEEALAAYDAAIAREPEDGENYWRRGAVLQKLDRIEEAEKELRKSVSLDPELESAKLALARLLTATGRTSEALRLIAPAAGAEPSTGTKVGLAEIELASGRPDQALALLEAARSEEPENGRVLVLLGPLYAQKGRLDEARDALELALSLGETSAEVRRNLALVHLQSGDPSRALRELRQASAADPGDASVWFSLGNAQLRAGRFGEAAAALEKAVELDPDREEALFNLALAYERAGRNALAVEAYRRYLATDVVDDRRRAEAAERIDRLGSSR